jgi:hypothetical protein
MKASFLMIAAAVLAPAAFADLIISPTQISGAGLGNLTTILTIDSQAGGGATNTFESGCITLLSSCPGTSGSLDFTSGNVLPQSAVQTLPTGVTAEQLRFIFNGNQTGAQNEITLNQLSIPFFDASGNLLHVANFIGPTNLTTLQGIGQAGFQLMLDTTQAGVINGFLAQGPVRVGAALNAGCGGAGQPDCSTGFAANGGFEAVQFATAPAAGTVPEPSTWGMLGVGLSSLLFAARRRKHS